MENKKPQWQWLNQFMMSSFINGKRVRYRIDLFVQSQNQSYLYGIEWSIAIAPIKIISIRFKQQANGLNTYPSIFYCINVIPTSINNLVLMQNKLKIKVNNAVAMGEVFVKKHHQIAELKDIGRNLRNGLHCANGWNPEIANPPLTKSWFQIKINAFNR